MFGKVKEIIRKTKPDDRFHVNPTISVKLKEQIERLAFILDQPVGGVGEMLFLWGVDERDVNERLAPHFMVGNLIFDKTLFIGHPENDRLNVTIGNPSDRISIRFDEDGYHDVELYSDLMDLEKSKVVAVMMNSAIRHPAIIEELLQFQNRRMSFDEVTVDELKKLMQFINTKNPYKVAWNEKLLQIVDGYTPKRRIARRPITPECVDTETYKWDI